MANGVFNIAKGRVNELQRRVVANDPASSAIVLVLLKTVEVDGTIQDYDTLDAMLTAGGGTVNVEADFTNYARKVLTDTELSNPTVDDGGNSQWADMPDQTFTSAGGATNNTLVKAIVCYDNDTGTGTDANLIPLTYHDFSATTDGNDLIAQIAATGYFDAS